MSMQRHRPLRLLCVFTDAVLLLVVVGVATLAVSGLPGPDRSGVGPVFGKSVLAVTSGSMSPKLQVGDAIVADVDLDPEDIAVGDVIVFRSAEAAELIITHRVLSRQTTSTGDVVFTTGGDANDAPDGTAVARDQVVGRLDQRLPKVGYLLAAADSTAAVALFAVGSVLAHGALVIVRSADATGVSRRRGDPNHRKDNT